MHTSDEDGEEEDVTSSVPRPFGLLPGSPELMAWLQAAQRPALVSQGAVPCCARLLSVGF